MEVLTGFLIALAVGLTGIGAGSVTAPMLMLFFGVPAASAVTVALVFGTVIKLIAAPLYLFRGQVDFRVLKYLAMGGLPGVLIGSLLLEWFHVANWNAPILALVGVTIFFSASANLWRSRPGAPEVERRDRVRTLPWIAAPIGLEVGFSSAGAGALGTLAIMQFTTLLPSRVVGTDLAFGLLLSIVGGGIHVGMSGVNTDLLGKLLLGGIPGVLIGAQLTHVLPAKRLRVALCLWLVYIGLQLLYKGAGQLVPVALAKTH